MAPYPSPLDRPAGAPAVQAACETREEGDRAVRSRRSDARPKGRRSGRRAAPGAYRGGAALGDVGGVTLISETAMGGPLGQHSPRPGPSSPWATVRVA